MACLFGVEYVHWRDHPNRIDVENSLIFRKKRPSLSAKDVDAARFPSLLRVRCLGQMSYVNKKEAFEVGKFRKIRRSLGEFMCLEVE